MQANKIQGEFRYTPVGPDHNRYVLMEWELVLDNSSLQFFFIFQKLETIKN